MLLQLFQRYVSMVSNGEIRSKSGSRLKPKTVSTYRFCCKAYERFGRDIDLEKMDLSGKSQREKSSLADKFDAHFNLFIKWMEDAEFKQNSRSDVMKVTNIVVRYWSSKMFLTLPKVRQVQGRESPIITLPQDMVRRLLNDKSYTDMSGEERYMWEVCSIMLITSLRIGDAATLTQTDFQAIDGELYLMRENEKTQSMSTLPLPPVIGDRIKSNLSTHGSVYNPAGSGVDFIRRNLRKFLSKYITQEDIVSVKKEDGSIFNGSISDIVHPHMLRKTAITSMIKSGVSVDHVRFASGHKSSAINRYIGWVERTHNSEVRKYHEKFFDEKTVD